MPIKTKTKSNLKLPVILSDQMSSSQVKKQTKAKQNKTKTLNQTKTNKNKKHLETGIKTPGCS